MRDINKKIGILLFFTIILFLGGCSSTTPTSKSPADGQTDKKEKIKIVTTIAQIGEPLSVIGGERVEVKSLMGPSVDPHLYQASHGDIETLENADLIFYNGLNLEANMVNIFNELAKIKPVLAVGETIDEKRLLRDEKNAVDPHLWFDLDLWKEALQAATDELITYSPNDSEYFENNKEKYFAEIDRLKEEAKKLGDIPKEQRYLVTAHDAFGYFGRMHDLEVVGLQGLSTDGEISVSDIQQTIDLIKKYRVPAVFIESSINEGSIRAVIEGAKSAGIDVALGGELFSDAMGEAGTEEGTYIGMYRHNINTIYRALMEGND